MIKAEIIADSISEQGHRITTMKVTFPRFILAELNTHRMFSRNSASSRAIPFRKMVNMVKTNPFIPIAWQKEHTGMQGTEYITQEGDIHWLRETWIAGSEYAIQQATILTERYGCTKQIANRQLEAYMWHTVLITATEWENFFHLRCPQYSDGTGKLFRSKADIIEEGEWGHDDPFEYDSFDWYRINKGQAEIHMMALAEAMWDAYNESLPEELQAGQWHIPFVDEEMLQSPEWDAYCKELFPGNDDWDTFEPIAIKIATARCARVSYTVVGEDSKESNYESDIKLHDRLALSGHWSPFEHCAKVMTEDEYYSHSSGQDGQASHVHGFSGNFRGFIQYRKMFTNENITK